jgi:hypothetical protein
MTESKSWRDTLPIHPAAELFPRMSPDELRALGKDIRKLGLTSPIVLFSDGKSPVRLLDGRSRLDAIESEIGPAIVGAPSITAGKKFLAIDKVIVLNARSVDPYAYVISANIHRRHLTAEQKRDLIAKLIKATPEKSDRQIAETVKVSPTTVGTIRARMEATGDVSNLDTRTDSKGRRQPARKTTTKPPPVSEEILQQRAASAERIRALMGGKTRDGPTGNEVEATDEGSELRVLLFAWDRASQGTREKFKARVGLVAVEPPAKVMDDGLDIPEYLRRATS